MEAHKVLDIMALTLLLFAFAAIANTLLLTVERRVHRQCAAPKPPEMSDPMFRKSRRIPLP